MVGRTFPGIWRSWWGVSVEMGCLKATVPGVSGWAILVAQVVRNVRVGTRSIEYQIQIGEINGGVDHSQSFGQRRTTQRLSRIYAKYMRIYAAYNDSFYPVIIFSFYPVIREKAVYDFRGHQSLKNRR
ncbi:hypothetical protein PHLCEN_2v2553 [Hermanssonia centrifuga]|uniref:Uncharacterized protein n=1 Tax=Hermanssonia centrifuga TaxID=98765 RepID=A0A2R6RLM9_9APHY|nr:hypothetical protein PHLCEN_2v2553 [Hermanssonia centrifuga]